MAGFGWGKGRESGKEVRLRAKFIQVVTEADVLRIEKVKLMPRAKLVEWECNKRLVDWDLYWESNNYQIAI